MTPTPTTLNTTLHTTTRLVTQLEDKAHTNTSTGNLGAQPGPREPGDGKTLAYLMDHVEPTLINCHKTIMRHINQPVRHNPTASWYAHQIANHIHLVTDQTLTQQIQADLEDLNNHMWAYLNQDPQPGEIEGFYTLHELAHRAGTTYEAMKKRMQRTKTPPETFTIKGKKYYKIPAQRTKTMVE